jgi:multiple sugar transport system substrate-binding protein
LLVKYLALNTEPLLTLAKELGNVPTTFAALKDPELRNDPQFKTFLDIFANKDSRFNPPLTTIGTYPADQQGDFLTKFESGKVPDPQVGLEGLAKEIDDQLTLGA